MTPPVFSCRRAATRILAAVAVAIVIAGCGSDSGGGDEVTVDTSTPKGKVPAQIVDKPQGYVSNSVATFENAWRVASKESYTEVDAGALVSDSSIGLLTIFRQRTAALDQEVNVIKVLGAGALTITKAPEGAGVEESAQKSGKIEFSSANGVEGSLDLGTDSVNLNPED